MVILPEAETQPAANSRPMSMEPESPMKIRAGAKLCGRKPAHTPTSTVEMIAGG